MTKILHTHAIQCSLQGLLGLCDVLDKRDQKVEFTRDHKWDFNRQPLCEHIHTYSHSHPSWKTNHITAVTQLWNSSSNQCWPMLCHIDENFVDSDSSVFHWVCFCAGILAVLKLLWTFDSQNFSYPLYSLWWSIFSMIKY